MGRARVLARERKELIITVNLKNMKVVDYLITTATFCRGHDGRTFKLLRAKEVILLMHRAKTVP